MNKTIINLVTILAVIILLFFGYKLLFKPGVEAGPEVGLEAAGFADASREETDEFLQILLSLQRLDLSSGTSLFALPAFQALQDFSTELQMKVPGRADPFQPVLLPTRNVSPTSPATPAAN